MADAIKVSAVTWYYYCSLCKHNIHQLANDGGYVIVCDNPDCLIRKQLSGLSDRGELRSVIVKEDA
ncbi:MAG: hypothetical protein DRJ31_07560 [Candidatus Methanomethylicota archaeon]|uniref:Uncharacterized protein n=1 Tax=Thermoproteota archaeon TaxID=2056631 RepID=A0A497F0V8_9CREN|nr:MAG: hypothetical protein DRJ31_07560 [Candidatus Verstraetearchaeota archaeon]RLE52942.1 MAG: hypothetical protein DRJ33_02350 [Candidatus Verstraetearchaeota archaeon]